jgi:uncharacterized membrane protein
LSPGINEPCTARACIHRLGTGLKELLDHPGQPPVTRDEEGRIRIVHHQQPFGYYCSLALRPLMNAGRDHAEVLSEIADMLGSIGGMAARQDRRDEIRELLDALEQTVDRSELIKADQAWVRGRIEAAGNGVKAD